MGGSFGGDDDHVNRKSQYHIITAVEAVKTQRRGSRHASLKSEN